MFGISIFYIYICTVSLILQKMKKNYAFALIALALSGCMNDAPIIQKDDSAEKVADMLVPASFTWKATTSVDCDFTTPHASKVFLSLKPQSEPFAAFIAGNSTDAVSVDVPAATRTLYVSYETPTGVSEPQAVSISGGKISYAVAAAAKNYGDELESSTSGSVIYLPATSQGWGTLLYEDLWPACGDYDFNDLVFNYKIQLYMNNKNKVNAMMIGLRVKAVGGSLPYDLYLSMLGVKGGEIDEIEAYPSGFHNAPANANLVALNSENNVKSPAILSFRNIRENANRPAGATYLNTERGYEMDEEEMVEVAYMVYFRNSIAQSDVKFDSFDFYIADAEGREIHMGGYAPTENGEDLYNQLRQGNDNIGASDKYYYSNDNLVWALNIPAPISHAYGSVDFLDAYPEFKTWAQSGGAASQDWYLRGANENLVRK